MIMSPLSHVISKGQGNVLLLSNETLMQVGRFAIEFNTLDELIRILAAVVLECEEWDVAQHLAEGDTARRNVARVRKISDILAKKYGLADAELHKALLEQLSFAEEVITQRNAVIHGELTVKRGKQPIVQLKKQTPVEMSPAALSELVRKTDSVTNKLLDTHTAFMHAVYEARDAAPGATA